MIGGYGSGSSRPHTEDELIKARQALSLLKARKERGETAAQKIGAYMMGGGMEGKYAKQSTTAYDERPPMGTKAGNSNYRKVFKPEDEMEEEKFVKKSTYSNEKGVASHSKLDKLNSKYNGGGYSGSEHKPMSNLANLGKKALTPVSEAYSAPPPKQAPVANEFGMKPSMPKKASTKREIVKPPPPQKKPEMERSEPVDDDDDRPIKPSKGGPAIPEVASVPTDQCQFCGRKFNPESLEKHEGVCLERPDKKKRKAFDATKKRIVSKEQQQLILQSKKKDEKPAAKKGGKIPKWKLQSAQFRAAMKSSNPDGAGGEADGGEPAYDEKSFLTQCPTCGRSFNDEAAKRHIPFCANKSKMDAVKGFQKGKPPAKKGYHK